MNWSTLIWFGIGLVVYLVGLGVFVLIKRVHYKKNLEKELKAKEQEENETKQAETSND